MPLIKKFELDSRELTVDAVDSWEVIVPIVDEEDGGIIAYTVGAEPYSLAKKLTELNPDNRSEEDKEDIANRFTVLDNADSVNRRDFEKSARNNELVAIGHFGRCRVLVYVLKRMPSWADMILQACIAMG